MIPVLLIDTSGNIGQLPKRDGMASLLTASLVLLSSLVPCELRAQVTPSSQPPVAAREAQALLDYALAPDNTGHLPGSEPMREQIHLGRLSAALQQDIEIAKQLQELLGHLTTLKPHARGLSTILADVSGVHRLRLMLEHIAGPGDVSVINEQPRESPKLVFLLPEKSAIFEHAGKYHRLEPGGEIRLPNVTYTLVAVRETGAELQDDQGDRLNITLQEPSYE